VKAEGHAAESIVGAGVSSVMLVFAQRLATPLALATVARPTIAFERDVFLSSAMQGEAHEDAAREFDRRSVVLGWGVVAHVADADLRERQRTPQAAQRAA
jgi:hypothetical protein